MSKPKQTVVDQCLNKNCPLNKETFCTRDGVVITSDGVCFDKRRMREETIAEYIERKGKYLHSGVGDSETNASDWGSEFVHKSEEVKK